MSVPTKLQKKQPYEKVYWGARQKGLGVRLTTHKVAAEDLGSEEDQEEDLGAEDQDGEDQDAEDQEEDDIKSKYNIYEKNSQKEKKKAPKIKKKTAKNSQKTEKKNASPP